MMSQRDDPQAGHLFALTMNRRPAEELYDLRNDPHQLRNVARDARHATALGGLRQRLERVMATSGDPLLTDAFDRAPWVVAE